MTKSYSEQICKICRIEPLEMYICREEKCPRFRDFTVGSVPPYWIAEVDCDQNCPKLYPNFESNDNGNFMKLFNLKYDNEDEDATIAGYVYSRYKNIVNTHWFLGFLLFELEHGKNADVEKIKKVIKETKWEI